MRSPEDQLAAWRTAGLHRQLRQVDPREPPVTRIDGRDFINFSSNDYLGLSQDDAVVNASRAATAANGAGSTASRLICGSLPIHHQLESRLAALKKTEAALVFSTGYAAALGSLMSLLEKGDLVILDKLCHASLIDGARLSGATTRIYPHHNLAKLERLLASARRQAAPDSRILVVTESIFSMDGDRAPLLELITLAERFGALLLVDEAHALGVLGPSGQGLAEELGLQERIDFQLGTLGKAAGSAGGYLAARRSWIELLINSARSFIYSTAPPPGQAAAALAGLEVIASSRGAALRETLWTNIRHFARLCGGPADSAIVPLMVGDNESALAASQQLLEAGFLIPAIRFPTVPRGTARLRITLSSAHRPSHLEDLARTLRRLKIVK